jgi:3-oxoacyl-[acyl-carrier protein] reductase
MDLRIAGRTALVCGSSSGLGRAIAHTLLEEGCRVALNGRTQDRLERTLESFRRRPGSDVEAFRADVGVAAEAHALVHQVKERFGSVDILVCNAGGPPAVSFHDAPVESWQAALDLNLLSAVQLARAAVPLMRKRQWGRIVCLTSIAARQPLPGLILSTTARAGLHGFAKSLADELAPDGITVNLVCPGYMRTERVEDLAQQRSAQTKRTTHEVMAGFVQDVPVGRMGEPDELAAAVAFLASERASYITGATLQVDGGFLRSIA